MQPPKEGMHVSANRGVNPVGARVRRRLRLRLLPFLLVMAAGFAGCQHAPPVQAWQRGHLVRRALRFDEGLEGRFRQHMFSSREGAEGGYGQVGGGCGCN